MFPNHKARAKAVLGLIPREIGSVLDVGCGPGDITKQIEGCEVTGLDPITRYLKAAKYRTVVGRAEALPFGGKSFDLVMCNSVLEHIPGPAHALALQEIKRVAKTYVLISVPYMEQLEAAHMKCSQCGHAWHISRHLRSYSAASMNNMFMFPDWQLVAREATGKSRHWDERILSLKRAFDIWRYQEGHYCPICKGIPVKRPDKYAQIEEHLAYVNRYLSREIPSHLTTLFKRAVA